LFSFGSLFSWEKFSLYIFNFWQFYIYKLKNGKAVGVDYSWNYKIDK